MGIAAEVQNCFSVVILTKAALQEESALGR